MNSSDLTVWVAQGSKEKKSIEYFLTTFEFGSKQATTQNSNRECKRLSSFIN